MSMNSLTLEAFMIYTKIMEARTGKKFGLIRETDEEEEKGQKHDNN